MLGDKLVALVNSSWTGSKSAKSKYSQFTIFCVTFCGQEKAVLLRKMVVEGKLCGGARKVRQCSLSVNMY